MRDLFGPGASYDKRLFADYQRLEEWLEALRKVDPDMKVGLTSGTFDMLHIGHARYLAEAKKLCGDPGILIVGVDTDAKVRKRKGPKRPLDVQSERFEIVCHSRYADIVVPKDIDHPRWHLIKTVKPDMLIISEREYEDGPERDQLRALVGEWGGKLEVMPSQAATSTTARLRILLLEGITETLDDVQARFDTLMGELRQRLTGKE